MLELACPLFAKARLIRHRTWGRSHFDFTLLPELASRLLQLLLRPELVRVTALLLPAIHRTGVEPGVTLAADHLVAIVLPRQHSQRWLDDAPAQAQDEMKSGLLLDIVIAESAAIFELLSCEDETLLVRRDTFFILNFGLHVVNRV